MELNTLFLSWGIASLAGILIGLVWYSPAAFGKKWLKAMGMTESDLLKQLPAATVWLFLGAVTTAFVLLQFARYTAAYTDLSGMAASLFTAVFAWAGFSATTLLIPGAFNSKRTYTVLFINLGNRLATYIVMALIIGYFI